MEFIIHKPGNTFNSKGNISIEYSDSSQSVPVSIKADSVNVSNETLTYHSFSGSKTIAIDSVYQIRTDNSYAFPTFMGATIGFALGGLLATEIASSRKDFEPDPTNIIYMLGGGFIGGLSGGIGSYSYFKNRYPNSIYDCSEVRQSKIKSNKQNLYSMNNIDSLGQSNSLITNIPPQPQSNVFNHYKTKDCTVISENTTSEKTKCDIAEINGKKRADDAVSKLWILFPLGFTLIHPYAFPAAPLITYLLPAPKDHQPYESDSLYSCYVNSYKKEYKKRRLYYCLAGTALAATFLFIAETASKEEK